MLVRLRPNCFKNKSVVDASQQNINIQLQYLPQMKYLAAYTLLSLSGKKDIAVNDIKNLLAASNVAFNQEEATRVIASLKGKQVHQLIAEGHVKIGSGSGPAPAASTTSAKPAAKEAPKKEEPKKVAPKKEEPKVEEDEDLGGLFD